jgi:hypothetical protein
MKKDILIIENFIKEELINYYFEKIKQCPILSSGQKFYMNDENDDSQEVSNMFVDINYDQSLPENINSVLDKVYVEIKNSFCANTEKELGMGITVLSEGYGMPLHVDKGYGDADSIGDPKTPSQFPSREVSSVFYWNDNYDGGEIAFPKQSLHIKPTAGMLILFPSTNEFPHKVLPVTKGLRYVSTNFWYCKWD